MLKENKLGQEIGTFEVREHKTKKYFSVKTGIADYLGDEIILFIYPEKKLVTDEGHTEFSLETDRRRLNLVDAKLFIESYGVRLTNTYNLYLEIDYRDDKWRDAVNKLTSCIVDTYAVLLAGNKSTFG